MTETSYQECRKVMRKINYLRGVITSQEGNVAKWTKIESAHREQLRHAQADGAKKCLDNALKKLAEVRAKFAALKFPESDLVEVLTRCPDCGRKIENKEATCPCIYE